MSNNAFRSRQGMPLNSTAPYLEIRPDQVHKKPSVPRGLSHKSQMMQPVETGLKAGEIVRQSAVQYVPVGTISRSLMVRDRLHTPPSRQDEIALSIAQNGLRNPIVVQPTSTGPELVHGLRRLTAYQDLFAKTGDAAWQFIPAIVLPKDTKVAELYHQMIAGNGQDGGYSFAEMAKVAMTFAADPDTDENGVDAAILVLFGHLSARQRDTIGDFAKVLDLIESDLRHPTTMTCKLGKALAKSITTDPSVVRLIRSELAKSPERNGPQERLILWRCLNAPTPS